MSTFPLPAGWTEARVKAMLDTGDDSGLEGMPLSDVELIVAYETELRRPAIEAARAAKDARRQELGLPIRTERRAERQAASSQEDEDAKRLTLLPLPAGWTQARVNDMLDSGDKSQLADMSFSDRKLIMDYRTERKRPAREAAEAANEAELQRLGYPTKAEREAEREAERLREEEELKRLGIKDGAGSGLANIVEQMRREYLDKFGFAVVRATCYTSGQEARWEEYKQKLYERFDACFEDCGGTPGMGLCAKFEIVWIEDASLEGASVNVARQQYATKDAANEIPNGVGHELFLVVDEECVASLLDSNDTTKTPYMIAVDKSDPMELDEDCRDSIGHFMVAVDAVPVNLWFEDQTMAPEEYEPMEGRIWFGIGESVAK